MGRKRFLLGQLTTFPGRRFLVKLQIMILFRLLTTLVVRPGITFMFMVLRSFRRPVVQWGCRRRGGWRTTRLKLRWFRRQLGRRKIPTLTVRVRRVSLV